MSNNNVATPLTFKDFFPDRNVTTIRSGSELYLVYALDKYCVKILGRRFSIANVCIDKHLYKSNYFAFLRRSGYSLFSDTVIALPREELKEGADKLNMAQFFTDTVEDVTPAFEDGVSVTYSFTVDKQENRKMRGASMSTAYINLVAYRMVITLVLGIKRTVVIDNSIEIPRFREYADLNVLRDYGNMLLTPDICIYIYAEGDKIQPELEAYITYNNQRGYMTRQYTVAEKMRVCRSLWKVGDVVNLYKRKDIYKRNKFKPVISCYPAVILGIEKTGLRLREIPTIMTALTQRKTIEQNMQISPDVYRDVDFTRFPTPINTYSWDNLGVGVAMYDEGMFIMEIIEEDTMNQWLEDVNGPRIVSLSTPDVVYAVLTDRKVKFNKKRFLEIYFKNKVPVYEVFAERRKQAKNGNVVI